MAPLYDVSAEAQNGLLKSGVALQTTAWHCNRIESEFFLIVYQPDVKPIRIMGKSDPKKALQSGAPRARCR